MDNIFQSILKACEHEGKEVFMMLVDLKSAYDMMNRDTLLMKLKQLGFPSQITEFLKNYHTGDYIEAKMGQVKSS